MFGQDYRVTGRELARSLALKHDPISYFEVPDDMQRELDYIWGEITNDFSPDHEAMNNSLIHNPAIRYFYMVAAQTFFWKS